MAEVLTVWAVVTANVEGVYAIDVMTSKGTLCHTQALTEDGIEEMTRFAAGIMTGIHEESIHVEVRRHDQ